MKEKIKKALYKKALGYSVKETVEEFSCEDELIKKKITTKHIPPDITALKIYIDYAEQNKPYENLTDEELEQEKIRLLKQLKEDK
ncbi:MAG: hypothetical protein RR454_05385 [Clostridia bacterium]